MKLVGIVLLSLIGLILLALVLVLLVPLGVKAVYRDKVFSLQIRWLFLRLTLLPKKEKKQKKKRPPKSKKKKESQEKNPDEAKEKEKPKKKKKLTFGIIKKLLTRHLPPILHCFYISTLHLKWNVHAQEAADTAIRYSAEASMMAGILGILDRFAERLKHAEVDIFPNYDEGSIEGDITVSVTVGRLLYCSIRLMIDLIRYKVI